MSNHAEQYRRQERASSSQDRGLVLSTFLYRRQLTDSVANVVSRTKDIPMTLKLVLLFQNTVTHTHSVTEFPQLLTKQVIGDIFR